MDFPLLLIAQSIGDTCLVIVIKMVCFVKNFCNNTVASAGNDTLHLKRAKINELVLNDGIQTDIWLPYQRMDQFKKMYF